MLRHSNSNSNSNIYFATQKAVNFYNNGAEQIVRNNIIMELKRIVIRLGGTAMTYKSNPTI